MRHYGFYLFRGLALSLGLIAGAADACPKGQYESCLFGVCVCIPEIGGSVGAGAEHLKNEVRAQTIGYPLEQWFYASRSSSNYGAAPIPPKVRNLLTNHIDETTLNSAQYKIGDNGFFNLAHVNEHLGLYDVSAVTLIDIIVFRGPTESGDLCLWAHELTHVRQFRQQGVRDFSIRYARNPASEEDEAYAVQNRCNQEGWAWGGGGMTPPPGGIPQPTAPQFGTSCYTPYGKFGPGPALPVGSTCSVMFQQGPVLGQVGP